MKKILEKVIRNSIFNWEDNKWSLQLMITVVLSFYNNKYKNSTTKMISKKFYLITKNKEMIEKLIINTEKSRKFFNQEIYYDVWDSILITSWLLELPNKRIRIFYRISH